MFAAIFFAAMCAGGCPAQEDNVKHLEELLAIPSVSDEVEACDRATEWMKSYLESRGVWCRTFAFPDAGGRKVLYAATKPELKHPDYVLVTHLDVVAAPPEQFVPKREGNRLYARGTCDTKANAFCGANALVALNGKASVGCIFASNEETGGTTTKFTLDNGYGYPAKAIIVLDAARKPDNIPYACMGNAYYKVTAYGKSGHSSVPEQCDNPIYKLAEAALKLRDSYPKREPGEWKNCASVTVLGAGDSPNRIPESASMTVNVRFAEEGGLEKERVLVEKITGLETKLIRGTPAATGNPDAPEFARIRSIAKKHYPDRSCEPGRTFGACDMRWFGVFDGAIACLGINQDGGHSDKEWCEFTDLDNFTDMVIEICK